MDFEVQMQLIFRLRLSPINNVCFVQNSPLVVCPAGADVLSQAQDEASILYEAAASGDPSVISLLLEYGADPNVAKLTGHMPIHRVAHRGHLE